MIDTLSQRPQNNPEKNPTYFAKCTQRSKERSIKLRAAYEASPRICQQCSKIIPWEQRNNKFCSSTCSAKYNNARRSQESYQQQKVSLLETIHAKKPPHCVVSFQQCRSCGNIFRRTRQRSTYCSDECKNNISLDSIKHYRKLCKFKLNNKVHPELFDSQLISKFGWYSPANQKNNLSGVCWDHLYRIEDGFKNQISPSIMSHPANAELVPWPVNFSRKTSMISLNELFERIVLWDSGERNLQRFYKQK